jgi:hypothetical protein
MISKIYYMIKTKIATKAILMADSSIATTTCNHVIKSILDTVKAFLLMAKR